MTAGHKLRTNSNAASIGAAGQEQTGDDNEFGEEHDPRSGTVYGT